MYFGFEILVLWLLVCVGFVVVFVVVCGVVICVRWLWFWLVDFVCIIGLGF